MKRFVLMLLSVVLSVGILACGAPEEQEGNPVFEDTDYVLVDNPDNPSEQIKRYNLTLLDHGQSIPENPKYQQEIREQMNRLLRADLGFEVNLTFKSYLEDDFTTKFGQDLTNKNQVDLVRISDINTLSDYFKKHYILNLNTVVTPEKTPNFKNTENISDMQWAHAINDTGITIAIPITNWGFTNCNWIRRDLLEKHSIAMPQNLTEFKAMLYALMEKEFAGSGQYVWAGPIECIENTIYGYYTDTPSDILVDGKIRPKYYDPAYRAMLKDIHDWIVDGIIDKSMLSDNLFGSANLYAQGKVGMLASSIMGYEYIPTIKNSDGVAGFDTAMLTPTAPKYGTLTLITEYLAIPATSKNPNVAAQFADWYMYNESNFDLVRFGKKNLTYEIVDGKRTVPSVEVANGIDSVVDLVGFNALGGNMRFEYKYPSDRVPQKALDTYRYYMEPDFVQKIYMSPVAVSLTTLTRSQSTTLGNANTAVQTWIESYLKFNRGDIDDWESAVIEQFRKKGGETIYDLYTETYNKNIEKLS